MTGKVYLFNFAPIFAHAHVKTLVNYLTLGVWKFNEKMQVCYLFCRLKYLPTETLVFF